MIVYLDNCCYNRPFDKRSQERGGGLVHKNKDYSVRAAAVLNSGVGRERWVSMDVFQTISDSCFIGGI